MSKIHFSIENSNVEFEDSGPSWMKRRKESDDEIPKHVKKLAGVINSILKGDYVFEDEDIEKKTTDAFKPLGADFEKKRKEGNINIKWLYTISCTTSLGDINTSNTQISYVFDNKSFTHLDSIAKEITKEILKAIKNEFFASSEITVEKITLKWDCEKKRSKLEKIQAVDNEPDSDEEFLKGGKK